MDSTALSIIWAEFSITSLHKDCLLAADKLIQSIQKCLRHSESHLQETNGFLHEVDVDGSEIICY